LICSQRICQKWELELAPNLSDIQVGGDDSAFSAVAFATFPLGLSRGGYLWYSRVYSRNSASFSTSSNGIPKGSQPQLENAVRLSRKLLNSAGFQAWNPSNSLYNSNYKNIVK
jgi:hypothetical protein